MLTDSKYKIPLETLKTRNGGYEPEDFVQDAVYALIKDFGKMSFQSIAKLKALINKSTEFKYLKETRKYYHTKSRGCAQPPVSLEEHVCPGMDVYKTIGETIKYEGQVEDDENLYDMHNLMQKNLLVAYNWKDAIVCKASELHKFRGYIILSVNYFLQAQLELCMSDVCKHYKDKGFHMTKNVFEQISQVIVDYARDNNMLECGYEPKKREPKYIASVHDKEEKEKYMSTLCTCGHRNEELQGDEETWQCKKCGKIHNRKELVKYYQGYFSNYVPQETKALFSQLKEESRIRLNLPQRFNNVTNPLKV